MTETEAITLLRDALWLIVKLSSPMLILGMLIGLLVSIIQTTTSIQEQTLTFVPKLITTFLALVVFSSWLIQTMLDYTKEIFSVISKI